MDQWIHRFRTAIPVPGQEKVLIPGDPERGMEIERMKNGIPLLKPVYEDLQYLAERFEVELV
jgi:LDH2 family malate/lactate/ureidoglycolate dehydrogenase